MNATDLHYRPLTEVAAALKRRSLSPVDLTKHILARIETLDTDLKSYTTVTAEQALAEAATAEREIMAGQYRGPLHGIPIAVKDLCYTKGVPTSAGMAIHKDFRPDHDATVVKRLRQAGAVILGKLHMTEGAGFTHHPEMPRPTNPWGAEIWTGVSSSGSGVATAAGLCYASLGSDTGGSIRYPSACCNLTGLKPTWGRVSRYGICDLGPSFDTVGPMARTAADAAAIMVALAGPDAQDPTSLLAPVPDYPVMLGDVFGARGLRIGIDWDFNARGMSAADVSLLKAAAETFVELGAALIDTTFPDPGPVMENSMALVMVEAATVHAETFPAEAERYGPWLAGQLAAARGLDPIALGVAMLERDKYRGRFARAFEGLDAILIPVFERGTPSWESIHALLEADMPAVFRFTFPINAVGIPALTLPCGFTDDGRPVGFQLIGPHLSEAVLLTAAQAYQQATLWHLRRPPL